MNKIALLARSPFDLPTHRRSASLANKTHHSTRHHLIRKNVYFETSEGESGDEKMDDYGTLTTSSILGFSYGLGGGDKPTTAVVAPALQCKELCDVRAA